MDKKKNREKVEKMLQSVGAMAEMASVFYRATLRAGADTIEATRLTQAYMGALLFGKEQKPPEEGAGA